MLRHVVPSTVYSKRAFVGAAVGVAMLLAPSAAAPLTATAASPNAAYAAAEPGDGGAAIPLRASEVTKLLGSRRDDVSLSVHDRRSGGVFSYNAPLENATGSIVKVMVLVAFIERRRESGRGLSEHSKALAERMIRYSDNDATNSLLAQAGGSPSITALAERLNMKSTKGRGAWGRTTTTATDQRVLMDAIVSGKVLTPVDRRYVLGLMRQVTPEQRWGAGTVPAGAIAEVKNGWVPIAPRGWRVNSIGHVTGNGRDYTIAMLSYDNPSMEAGTSTLNTLSGYVYRHLGETAGASVAAAGVKGTSERTPDEGKREQEVPPWIRSPGAAYPPRPWW